MIHAAAVDKRIKAAIVQCSSVSGETRSLAFQNRIPAFFEDRRRIVKGKERDRVLIIGQTELQQPRAKRQSCF